MLDTDTKRRIDTARNILVGKVPDPKSQVEQITIALIYKFMDDMDAESEELGGLRSFFTGEFARYGWAKLMRSGLGGHETLALYAEAISRMPENPGIPVLFRDIFKNAYLPYRDPETLRVFLKVIDEFNYDHSEKLGDAFEYLLSVLGSQGDAGQFRTPRHIIDFMVKIVDPKKDEKVLDPACGTAGFLISSYKHIIASNKDKNGDSTLTPDEKGRLARNFTGYDISPDMVRLSLVNMYLHGFADPHIYEYDTLTSQERWNEYADIILANPPFMSPKGGIRPHNRFSVQSKRSEVLFVDYMAEHLTPKGRAAIIVPEGIIFQSQNAYVQLRKMLVDEYLVAVVSLPAGVFNPYSGVKTSILILDKALAKRSNTIGFFKVENDGFGLGAQRRAIEKNDLPTVSVEIIEYLHRFHTGEQAMDCKSRQGLIIEKGKIAATMEYNLSAERYREVVLATSTFPMVRLGDICELVRGVVYTKKEEVIEDGVKVLRANNINKDYYELDLEDVKLISSKTYFHESKKLYKDDIFICLASGSKDHVGKVALIKEDTDFYFGGFMGVIRVQPERLISSYLFQQLTSGRFNSFLRQQIVGANISNLSGGLLYRFSIPLPPLDVQKEIVSEIEGYQKVIDGARAVIENYKPSITINQDWPLVKLIDVCETITDGDHQPPPKANNGIPFITISSINKNSKIDFSRTFFVNESYYEKLNSSRKPKAGDILYTVTGSYGIPVIVPSDVRFCFQRHIALIRTTPQLDHNFLYFLLSTPFMARQGDIVATGAAQKTVSINSLRKFLVPLPPLATQHAIVAEIEAEQSLVAANLELTERFEKKIRATLARAWGDKGYQGETQ